MENKKTSYMYIAYNLIIESSIILPELLEYSGEKNIDINIVESHFPIERKKDSDDSIFIPIENLVDLFISNGKKITFYKHPKRSENQIRSYILGWAIGVILIQRNIFPIHGSAVEKDNKCYLFIGESGAGKSTIAQTLVKRGFNFLNDDLCAVTLDEYDNPLVGFGYRQSKLCEDSAASLGYDLSLISKPPKNTGKSKYSLLIKNTDSCRTARLEVIYFINKDLPVFSEEKITLSQLKGIDKVTTLISNIYVPEAIRHLKKDVEYLKKSIKICSQIRFIKINRLDTFLNPNLIADFICEDIERNLKDAKENNK